MRLYKKDAEASAFEKGFPQPLPKIALVCASKPASDDFHKGAPFSHNHFRHLFRPLFAKAATSAHTSAIFGRNLAISNRLQHLLAKRFKRAEEAGGGAGVAGGACWVHEGKQRIGVAIVAQLGDLLRVSAGGALAPQLLATAAPEYRLAAFKRKR